MKPITVWIEKEGAQDTGERSGSWGSGKDNYHVTDLTELLLQLQESVNQSIKTKGKLIVQVQGTMVASGSKDVGWRPIFKIQEASQQTKTLTITLETDIPPDDEQKPSAN